jgi:hypothetical protein
MLPGAQGAAASVKSRARRRRAQQLCQARQRSGAPEVRLGLLGSAWSAAPAEAERGARGVSQLAATCYQRAQCRCHSRVRCSGWRAPDDTACNAPSARRTRQRSRCAQKRRVTAARAKRAAQATRSLQRTRSSSDDTGLLCLRVSPCAQAVSCGGARARSSAELAIVVFCMRHARSRTHAATHTPARVNKVFHTPGATARPRRPSPKTPLLL